MMFVLSKLLPLPLYPPGLCLTLLVVALVLLLRRRQRAGIVVLFAALVLLYVLSLPVTAHVIAGPLERRHWPLPEYPRVSAVVLLGGGGVSPSAPRKYPETNIFGDRLIHAARVFRASGAPWLISTGGNLDFVYEAQYGDAANNARLLTEVFGVDSGRILLGDRSRNTREDAEEVLRLLGEQGMRYDVLLVTSAMHMDRASRVFHRMGITTLEAPTDYMLDYGFQWKLLNFLPSARALHIVSLAVHEYYGILAYRVLGWI